jgi:large subunit ribosomal protein L3
VKTVELDGYEAVQLAFDPVAERKLSKAEVGHLKKASVEPHRHLVEFRGASELLLGESVTVEAFEPGDSIKVAGIGIGKGFAGTIKRHRFHRGPKSHGSHNIRKPGSIGASATPSRVFKGIKMAGRLGGKRVTQVGLKVHEVDARTTCCSSRAPSRARRTASSRSGRRSRMPAASTTKAPSWTLRASRRSRSRSTATSSPPR